MTETFLKNFRCALHGAMMRLEQRKPRGLKTLVCTGCERAAIMRAFGVAEDVN